MRMAMVGTRSDFRFLQFWLAYVVLLFVLNGMVAADTSAADGGTITGWVRDEYGVGLGGVEVLSHDGNPDGFRTTVTNADGSYVLADVPPGSNHLQASISGRAYSHYWGFDVSSGVTYPEVNFTLRPGGGTISGRVVDGSGVGIAGATINVFEQTAQGFDNGAWATTTTDSDGFYQTSATDAPGPGLPTGTYTVKASKDGYPDTLVSDVPVTSGMDTQVNLILTSGSGSISGTVTSEADGSPIAGAEVYVDNGSVQQTVFTDGAGQYLAGNLPDGGYNVVVSKAGYATAHRYSVMVSSGGQTSGVDFTLTTRMGRLSGRVTDTSGAPIVGASILADSDQGDGFGVATTDGNGEYLVTNLAPMTYYVHASAIGYASIVRLETVVEGAETGNVDFVLGQATGGIAGTVTKDGQPAASASVYANSSSGSSEVYYGSATTDGNGDYLIQDLPPGQYDVHVYDVPGYANQVRYGLDVSTTILTGVDFNLTNGDGSLFGYVTDASSGDPVEGVNVKAFLTESPGTWGSTFTDASGYYQFVNLWPGYYNVYAEKSGYPKAIRANVYVGAPRPRRFDLELGLPRELMVSPAPITVMVEGSFGTWRSVQIDVASGEATDWTAETSAPWLFLGASGNLHLASGTTGDTLVLRFDPSGVAYGTHQTTVDFSSSDAAGTTLYVTMIKVETLHSTFIPVVGR